MTLNDNDHPTWFLLVDLSFLLSLFLSLFIVYSISLPLFLSVPSCPSHSTPTDPLRSHCRWKSTLASADDFSLPQKNQLLSAFRGRGGGEGGNPAFGGSGGFSKGLVSFRKPLSVEANRSVSREREKDKPAPTKQNKTFCHFFHSIAEDFDWSPSLPQPRMSP